MKKMVVGQRTYVEEFKEEELLWMHLAANSSAKLWVICYGNWNVQESS
jgi:hypothetical protein